MNQLLRDFINGFAMLLVIVLFICACMEAIFRLIELANAEWRWYYKVLILFPFVVPVCIVLAKSYRDDTGYDFLELPDKTKSD